MAISESNPFLSTVEVEALQQERERKRTLAFARTLAVQTEALLQFGYTQEEVASRIPVIRENMESLSNKQLKALRHALSPLLTAEVAMSDNQDEGVSEVHDAPVSVDGTEESLEIHETMDEAMTWVDEQSDAVGHVELSDDEPVMAATEEAVTETQNDETAAVPSEEVTLAAATTAPRARRPRAEVPEGLQREVFVLFRDILPEEVIGQLADMDSSQQERLVDYMGCLYRSHSQKPQFADKQMNRLRQLMAGYDVRQVAEQEGASVGTVQQSFYSSLPKFYAKHSEGIVAEVATILADDSGVSSEQVVDTPHGAAVEVALENVVREELVERARHLTEDKELKHGMAELFSVEFGVHETSEASIHAAEVVRTAMYRRRVTIGDAVKDATARAAIERLLYGVANEDGRQYTTLSKLLEETPSGALRDKKQRVTQQGLERIFAELQGAPVEKRSDQSEDIEKIQQHMREAISADEPTLREVLSRMQGQELAQYETRHARFLGEFFQHSQLLELSPVDRMIVKSFTIPRPQSTPMSVEEISRRLEKDFPTHRDTSIEYVTSRLLEVSKKMITQFGDDFVA